MISMAGDVDLAAWRRLVRVRRTVVVLLLLAVSTVGLAGGARAAGTPLSGTGSSFVAPAIETWITQLDSSGNVGVSYTVTNSGTGRFEFTNQVTDFAITDAPYGIDSSDSTPPDFPFVYVPIVGSGVALMYNIPGLTHRLQLTSSTACAILTGTITNWDSSTLAAANPGVTLPNLAIIPVTESDSSGAGYAMEQWCLAEQPALWAAFAQKQEDQSGGPTDGVAISPTMAYPNWPGIEGGLDDQSTIAVASDVANNSGAVGAVETTYAQNEGFNGSNPSKNVALVENASGDFTPPTPVDVASALTYATPQSDGLQELDFDGLGPNVYNPSTISYLLTPTAGWPPAKGSVLSTFVNYALTLGQQVAPAFGFTSLGEPVEHFGLNEVASAVPGAVPMTTAEQAFYNCGDLTPSDAAAGNTAPSCDTSPGTGLPEAPYAVALPLLALAGIGGTLVLRRRRLLPIRPLRSA